MRNLPLFLFFILSSFVYSQSSYEKYWKDLRSFDEHLENAKELKKYHTTDGYKEMAYLEVLKAIRFNPESSEAYSIKGELNYYKGDYYGAMEDLNRSTVATNWKPINDLMDGGLGPGELGVVVAPSGVGKTWILTAIGAEAVRRGLSVVHYTMELSEHYVGARYDTVFTQIPSTDLKDKKDQVKSKIESLQGKLLIKYFPPKGVTVKKLQQHIEKMVTLDNKPDVIIVDYADLLLSHSNKSDSTYAEQGGVYIDLRGMSGELEIPIWTASQTNRSAIDSEVIEADKIADSYAKVMNADFIMSVSRKSKDKLNDTARAHIMKNRFGPDGITFPMKMNTNTGYMEVYDGTSPDGVIATKQSASGQLETKKLLHKKYVENMG